MRLAAFGLLGGLGVALIGMAIARTLLFGVPMLDLVTLGGIIAALASVIALAAVLPLREALRVSPMIALRTE
jgi:ABC-type antimicrobial peptide transport system permease subunit